MNRELLIRLTQRVVMDAPFEGTCGDFVQRLQKHATAEEQASTGFLRVPSTLAIALRASRPQLTAVGITFSLQIGGSPNKPKTLYVEQFEPTPRISASFHIDAEGAPHFVTHVAGDVSFGEMKDALAQLRGLIDKQFSDMMKCPHCPKEGG